jgi:Rrf2 family protein
LISQKARYGFKALIHLARAGRGASLNIDEIARGANVPRKFLEHILLDLKHHGVLASRRGPKGGYVMLRDPADLSIGAILRMIDGPIAPLACVSRTAYRRCEDCVDEETCAVRRVFNEVYTASLMLMEATTLEDACRDPAIVASDEESGRAAFV